MNKIRCAVIGVGYIGNFHAEKFTKLDEAELVAVVDANKDRAQEIANKYQTQAFTDYREIVSLVDAVNIAVPTQQHFAVAKYFLEHGKHVLIEKPITTTVAEAEELIAIAKTNGLILQVGHLERFNAVNIGLKGIMKTPLYVESRRLAPYTPRGADVNVVLDLMIHDIDLVQYMVRAPIESIDACGAPVLSNDVDIANARIRFENGCLADVTASRASTRSQRKIRMFQHDAYLSIDLQHRNVVIHRKGEKEIFPGIPEITTEKYSFPQTDAIKLEIEAFLKAIITGSPPAVSGEEGKNALATAIQITNMLTQQLELVKTKHPSYFE